ncbi:MAG TPA: hypothetical protein VG755_30510 [Nannocystaceae bacterium]|nr:hypothetical protein [Nannocystaceae bacterium]
MGSRVLAAALTVLCGSQQPLGLGLAFGVGWLALAPAAAAQPFRGTGASAPDPKDKTPAAVRQRALSKARRAALELALGELGKIGKAEKKSVLSATDAWTGAYRVLSEKNEGESVAIEVEVEIDVARLRKKVAGAPASDAKPLFTLAAVELGDNCGDRTAVARVEDELVVGHAVDKGGAPLTVSVACTPLGPVPHTFVVAARAVLEAKSEGRVVAQASIDSFGGDAGSAMQAAIAEAAQSVAASAALHRRGVVSVRVQGALPAARMRRFERALVQSVMGVSKVELAGVGGKGNVLLSVHGPSDAPALAQALGSFSAPGVKARVLAVEGPDALAIQLE